MLTEGFMPHERIERIYEACRLAPEPSLRAMPQRVSSQNFATQVLLSDFLPAEAWNWISDVPGAVLHNVWDFFQATKDMPAVLQRDMQDKAPQSKGKGQ